MSLSVSDLKTNLIKIRSTMYPTPDQAASDWCNAVIQFWMGATGPGESAPIVAACFAAMWQLITQAWSNIKTQPEQAAQQAETGVQAGILAIQMVGGAYNVQITVTPPPTGELSGGLAGLWGQSHITAEEVADKESTLIDSYSLQAVFTGTGISPAPPVIGPMS